LTCDNSTGIPKCLSNLPCDATTVGEKCQGNAVLQCYAGASGKFSLEKVCAESEPCTEVTALHQGTEVPVAYCKTDGPSCATEGASCDGTRYIRCYDPAGWSMLGSTETDPTRLVEFHADCAWRGLACQDIGGGAAGCVEPAGAACEADVYEETCDGSVLTTCAAGKVVSLDCASIQKTSCQPSGSTTSCL
jgi:hypothetical protein